MRGWAKTGVLARVFEALQQEQIIHLKIEAGSLDSTSVKVHANVTGALKKMAHSPSEDPEADLRRRFLWLPVMSGQHSVSPSGRDSAATAGQGPSIGHLQPALRALQGLDARLLIDQKDD